MVKILPAVGQRAGPRGSRRSSRVVTVWYSGVEQREPEHQVADRADDHDPGEHRRRDAQAAPVVHRLSSERALLGRCPATRPGTDRVTVWSFSTRARP